MRLHVFSSLKNSSQGVADSTLGQESDCRSFGLVLVLIFCGTLSKTLPLLGPLQDQGGQDSQLKCLRLHPVGLSRFCTFLVPLAGFWLVVFFLTFEVLCFFPGPEGDLPKHWFCFRFQGVSQALIFQFPVMSFEAGRSPACLQGMSHPLWESLSLLTAVDLAPPQERLFPPLLRRSTSASASALLPSLSNFLWTNTSCSEGPLGHLQP